MRVAHLLVQADPGRADEVALHLSQLDTVSGTAVTTGPYDVIAQVPLDEDLEHVLAHVKRAPGLARLCVCRAS